MAIVRVIACGNPHAADDAAGVVAVAAARSALESIPGVEVVPQASPLEVFHLLEGAEAVVVVDAIRTPAAGRAPGTIVRAEAAPRGLPAEIRSSLSSHGLGIAEAVGLAAAIGPAPRVVVLGVEAAEATAGGALSSPVERAVPELTRRIVAEARGLAGRADRAPADGSTGPSGDEGAQPR